MTSPSSQQLQAAAELAEQTYKRDQEQFAAQAISQASSTRDVSTLKSARAQVAAQQALIDEKIVKAPFAGRLGIRQVDLGQYLERGNDRRHLAGARSDPDRFLRAAAGARARQGSDRPSPPPSIPIPASNFAGRHRVHQLQGRPASRNVQVRASFQNADRRLVPGMFANVAIDTGEATSQITLPQTAITYNPYGDTVFIVEKTARAAASRRHGAAALRQAGRYARRSGRRAERRQRRATWWSSAGQMKLRNGMAVVINNAVRRRTTQTRRRRTSKARHADMKFTDIFIRRPVLATVVSLVILVVGLRSFSSLQVLAYPKTENGIVTIIDRFPGADPDAIAGFITTPIEAAVAQANGIDYMTSTSQSSTSTITV